MSELDAKTLLCTVEPHNEASLKLHQSLGFEQIETQPFEDFNVDGLFMYKIDIPGHFNMVPLADNFNHLMFICDLLTQPENVETLHLRTIPKSEYKRFYQEMKAALLHGADDESNYMITKGVVPIGWLKVKDECGDSLRISMLIVHEKYRNLGAGTFALQFAEEMAAANQYSHITVQIT